MNEQEKLVDLQKRVAIHCRGRFKILLSVLVLWSLVLCRS